MHPFFDPLRKIGKALPGGEPVPELFDFTSEEKVAAGDLIDKLQKVKAGEVKMDDMM